MILALPTDVRERLDRIEAEEGVPPIEVVHTAISVFSQLTGPERHALLTTNAVRGGSNRKVVADAMDVASLVMTCADEPWVVDGAAVRVSMICF